MALGAGWAFTGVLRGWDGVFKTKKDKMNPHAGAERALSVLASTHTSAVRLFPRSLPALKQQAAASHVLVWVLRWGISRPLGTQVMGWVRGEHLLKETLWCLKPG